MYVEVIIVAVLGLLLGSFANVVAYRVPRGESVVSPPSACPGCGTQIKPYDNIPVVSWLVLRGRCRTCDTNISVRYPLVEAATALLFASFAIQLGTTWVLPAYLAFAFVTMVLLLTDLDLKRIPNAILFSGGGLASGLLVVGVFLEANQAALPRAAIAGVVYFGVLLLIEAISRGGIGMGDVKLAALLGLFPGYLSWAVFAGTVIAGFVIGGLVGVVLLASGLKDRKATATTTATTPTRTSLNTMPCSSEDSYLVQHNQPETD